MLIICKGGGGGGGGGGGFSWLWEDESAVWGQQATAVTSLTKPEAQKTLHWDPRFSMTPIKYDSRQFGPKMNEICAVSAKSSKVSQTEKPPHSFGCILVGNWMAVSLGIGELLCLEKKCELEERVKEGLGCFQMSDFFLKFAGQSKPMANKDFYGCRDTLRNHSWSFFSI